MERGRSMRNESAVKKTRQRDWTGSWVSWSQQTEVAADRGWVTEVVADGGQATEQGRGEVALDSGQRVPGGRPRVRSGEGLPECPRLPTIRPWTTLVALF